MKILLKGRAEQAAGVGYCQWCHCVFEITRQKDVDGYGGTDYFYVRCPNSKCHMQIRFDGNGSGVLEGIQKKVVSQTT